MWLVIVSVPVPLPLTGVTWNVYPVLGIRPVAVNTLLTVPVTVSVVVGGTVSMGVGVGPKITLYPVISLFLSIQFTLSHWRDTLLELEEETTRFCTGPLGAGTIDNTMWNHNITTFLGDKLSVNSKRYI